MLLLAVVVLLGAARSNMRLQERGIAFILECGNLFVPHARVVLEFIFSSSLLSTSAALACCPACSVGGCPGCLFHGCRAGARQLVDLRITSMPLHLKLPLHRHWR